MRTRLALATLVITVHLAAWSASVHAQPPHLWSFSFGENPYNTVAASAVDGNGDIVVAGRISGSTNLPGTTLISAGKQDILLARYNATGDLLWAKRMGGSGFEYCTGLALDGAGAAYVVGTFYDPIDLGGVLLSSAGSSDFFVAKFDAGGNHVWSVGLGGTDLDTAEDIGVDQNVVYITGQFFATTNLGGGPLVSAGLGDIFLVRLDATTGTHLGSGRLGGTGSDVGSGIAFDGGGNLVLAGTFENSVDFGGGAMVSAGSRDAFVAKYAPSGVHVWSRAYGTSSAQRIHGVAVDAVDAILLAGDYQTSVDFGGGPIAGAGGWDACVAKLDATGNHVWSQGFGGPLNDIGQDVVTDAQGEVYLTGGFEGSVDFGGGPLASAGNSDIFAVKLSRHGVHRWSLSGGDTGVETGLTVAMTSTGEPVLGGVVFGAAMLGGGPIGADLDATLGFIVRLDTAGAYLWSRSVGSEASDEGRDVARAGTRHGVFTGYFRGTVDFGNGSRISAGHADVYLVKKDENGNSIWSRSFGGPNDDRGEAVVVDGAGSIYLAGRFSGTADVGGDPMVSAGSWDVFVAKYDRLGNHVWSRRFGGSDQDIPRDIAVDAAGDLYVTGYFLGSTDFGGGPLVAVGNYDVFLAKLDPTGQHLWSRSFGGVGVERSHALALDPAGWVVIVGETQGGVDFGGGGMSSAGATDVFLAQFAPDGTHRWSQLLGGTGGDEAIDGVIDAAGDLYVTGTFFDSIDLGGGPITSHGGKDGFLARYDRNGAHQWGIPLGGSGIEESRALALDPLGGVVWTGLTNGLVDLGGGSLLAQGEFDILLGRFAGAGNHLWSTIYGSFGSENPARVAVDSQSNVFLTGTIYDSINFGGSTLTATSASDIFMASLGGNVVGTEGPVPISATILGPAHPNPFRRGTAATLDLAIPAHTQASVFDVNGRRVRTLVDRELPRGSHVLQWDGLDDAGRRVGPGVYFLKVAGPGMDTTVKMVQVL